MTQSRSGPLAGLKVVEFAGIGPAPMAAMLLSDLGNESGAFQDAPHRWL